MQGVDTAPVASRVGRSQESHVAREQRDFKPLGPEFVQNRRCRYNYT